jgi:hypothetical protein
MRPHRILGRILIVTVAALAAQQPMPSWAEGEVVDYIEAKAVTNPPPSTALQAFDHFELAPFDMVAPYAGQDVNEEAKTRLQTNLDERLPPVLAEWNAKPARGTPPRVLKIEPTIRHVKFISGKARFWAGPFAGGTAVLVTVKLSDAATGEVIAEPEFYQHANAMGAAFSYGATDKAMLIRTTDMITEYVKANYSTAVGGPTGKEEQDAAQDPKKSKRKSKSKDSEGQDSGEQPTAQ